jgi:hypothetical protein
MLTACRWQEAFVVIAIAAVTISSRKTAIKPDVAGVADVADVPEKEVPCDSCFNR